MFCIECSVECEEFDAFFECPLCLTMYALDSDSDDPEVLDDDELDRQQD